LSYRAFPQFGIWTRLPSFLFLFNEWYANTAKLFDIVVRLALNRQETQVIPDFSDNPIKANLARTYEADPTIGKLIEAVDVSQIRDQNIHLSNFLTRLSTASVSTAAFLVVAAAAVAVREDFDL